MKKESRTLKKVLCAILIAFCCVVLLSLIAFGQFVYCIKYNRTLIETYRSVDGAYKLSVYEIGETVSLEPADCRIILSKGLRRIHVKDIKVSNNGVHPDSDNFAVTWYGDRAEISIHDMSISKGRIYVLYFDGSEEEAALGEIIKSK